MLVCSRTIGETVTFANAPLVKKLYSRFQRDVISNSVYCIYTGSYVFKQFVIPASDRKKRGLYAQITFFLLCQFGSSLQLFFPFTLNVYSAELFVLGLVS